MSEGVGHTVTDCMGRIGETLKKARELREIDLREISDATKINIRYLEAIETNHFDLLPGGVFNKGFIRAYASYIGLDGQTMVDNYVHDIEAGPDDSGGHDETPAGLHRPTAIPARRAAPLEPSGPKPAVNSSRSADTASIHDPAALHITGLQEVAEHQLDDPSPAGDPNVLPRIAWLMAATGLLFCILVAWKYVADPPGAPLEAEQAGGLQSSPAMPPTVTPASGTDGGEGTLLAGAITQAVEIESPSAGTEETNAGPQIAAPSAADDTPAVERPEPDSPATDGGPPDPLPPPKPLLEQEDDLGMAMIITARTDTRVRVICDGREAANREMRRGEIESLRCERLIRLSAPDASSIALAINGSACQPLGAPGSRLFGYVVRADDYRTLCPERMEGTDVTR